MTIFNTNIFNWQLFSYIGLFFAIIYRIPQITKIYRTKKADDISSYSYLTHNGAYISFIIYLFSTGKDREEWVLCLYYVIGMFQNILIYTMKRYYSKNNQVIV